MNAPPTVLRVAADDLGDRFVLSADTLRSPHAGSLDDVRAWLAERAVADRPSIRRIPIDSLTEWSRDPDTGDLVHRSGAFFRLRGLRVHGAAGPVPTWTQPIIHQPEIGILGILARQIDGVLCLLMQAKMEPGNINGIQLSPTVQATRSNYRRMHGGAATRYLEHFTEPGHGRVLVDVLQSEQGSMSHQKRNRNMIVEVDGDVPIDDTHRWVTLGQVRRLLAEPNVVNMNARSVLSNLPLTSRSFAGRAGGTPFADALAESLADRSGVIELQNWFNTVKCDAGLRAELVPLRGISDWDDRDGQIAHAEDRFFSVLGVSVGDSQREVTSWTQPLIAPRGQGVVAFLVSRAHGRLEVLLQAKIEAGARDIAEIAPTVQAIPDSYKCVPADQHPAYLNLVEKARPEAIRFDALQSEEGGRFYHAEHRYVIVEVDADVRDAPTPPGYRWARPGQLLELLRHSGYLNIEARSLLSCLHTLW